MALLVVRLTMGAAVVAAVIFLVVARRAAERRQFGGLSLVLTAVAGMLASMVAVLPSALWIARVDLQRTPAALLLLAPLTAALAGAVSWIERPRATVWTTVGIALLISVLLGGSGRSLQAVQRSEGLLAQPDPVGGRVGTKFATSKGLPLPSDAGPGLLVPQARALRSALGTCHRLPTQIPGHLRCVAQGLEDRSV